MVGIPHLRPAVSGYGEQAVQGMIAQLQAVGFGIEQGIFGLTRLCHLTQGTRVAGRECLYDGNAGHTSLGLELRCIASRLFLAAAKEETVYHLFVYFHLFLSRKSINSLIIGQK